MTNMWKRVHATLMFSCYHDFMFSVNALYHRELSAKKQAQTGKNLSQRKFIDVFFHTIQYATIP